MKGTKFPTLGGGVDALVHKSPEKRYDSAGGIIYRLVLKVDVHALKAERTAGEWPSSGVRVSPSPSRPASPSNP